MKSFVATSFLALMLTFTVCLPAGITINGQDALPLLKPTPEGNWLKCNPRKGESDNVSLRINKGAIEITSITIDSITAKIRIPLRFTAIQKANERLSRSEKLRSFRSIDDLSISFKDREIREKERICLEASMDMNLESVILTSTDAILTAKQFNFDDCFCHSKFVLLMSNNTNSLYKGILFSFDEEPSSNRIINGKIDFESDSGELEIFGVKEINIIFFK